MLQKEQCIESRGVKTFEQDEDVQNVRIFFLYLFFFI